MIRFSFTPYAEDDIDEIARYLQGLPEAPALRIGREIQKAIKTIVVHPAIGRIDHDLSRLSHRRIHRFICGQYVLFYFVANEGIVIIGLLHGKRDVDTVMRRHVK